MPLIYIEPFYGGSHQQVADTVVEAFSENNACNCKLISLSAKKWHWRMLASAPIIAHELPQPLFSFAKTSCTVLVEEKSDQFSKRVVLVSAMINLAELLGLRPDIRRDTDEIILYFHENQLEYPKSHENSQGSFNLGYNQIISCILADKVLFNSKYNMKSFLGKIDSFINRIPTQNRPTNLYRKVFENKCFVQFPLIKISHEFLLLEGVKARENENLHIVWPHRWEHDKDPRTFIEVLKELAQRLTTIELEKGISTVVKLSVLGAQDSSCEEEFISNRKEIEAFKCFEICHWGSIEPFEEYLNVLKQANLAVSTAVHEFFGIAMVEAALLGCIVMAPNRLSYQELFPVENLYNTPIQLTKKLLEFALYPRKITHQQLNKDWKAALSKFDYLTTKSEWERQLFNPQIIPQKRKYSYS